ncbi:hypothetical protein TNCT_4751 [Trichonephila clavata]|uniref:Uncharacterized protein n=1 Tax=Trichonephila clavata TaxID=2740835 RepID=A0A8X6K9W2_TRICU|nr:hypothetical protein TNCT_4751 [Trichonephila clavata]
MNEESREFHARYKRMNWQNFHNRRAILSERETSAAVNRSKSIPASAEKGIARRSYIYIYVIVFRWADWSDCRNTVVGAAYSNPLLIAWGEDG